MCCHNGASRMPVTLEHLQAQQPPAAPWEVLVIDNASTDGTTEVVRSCWQDGPAPLRIIDESRLGVRFARERGLREARFQFLGFVDDDNWVAHDWVRTAHHIMSADSELGAVSSIREPACEVSSPAWFDDFHSTYAVLTEQDLKQMHGPIDWLPTAGLCVRKAAWDRLIKHGFRSQLTGTVGQKLQGGEDTELTIALRLSGWKLAVDTRLRLQHFMPAQRLRWMYLRKLLRGYAASHVTLEAYTEYSLSLPPGPRRWLSERWWYQVGKSMRHIASRPNALMSTLLSHAEGRNEVIEIEQQFGRLLGLLQLRGRYGALRRDLRNALWRHCDPPRCF
jgi:glycosyltransferase involved in cell wall biosynthesis